jgi:hypothetical protein
MTAPEFSEVIALGFSADVVTSLEARGFRRAGIDPDDRTLTQFLRQTCTPNIRISLHPSADLEALDTAIHDAAVRIGHATLAGRFMDFFDHCKSWRPDPAPTSTLEARLAKLEEMIQANASDQ